jgi:threonine/homoserine/homoserine lactone efflux protein
LARGFTALEASAFTGCTAGAEHHGVIGNVLASLSRLCGGLHSDHYHSRTDGHADHREQPDHGTRAGLLNVAGTQLGLLVMLGVLMVGLSSVIAAMGVWFDYVRIAGAIYLVWIGWKLLRAKASFGDVGRTPKPRGGFLLQGFLVLMSNPKALLWFGAFIPQFVDPNGNYIAQLILLGLTAMASAALTDGAYAILGRRTRRFMSEQRVKLAQRVSGLFLIGGGVWLAFTRAR